MHDCDECGNPISIPDDVELGELVECPNCAVEFEVTGLDPILIEIFEEDEK